MSKTEKWKNWSPWDWEEIEGIIRDGKHPTNKALATALSGDKPIPKSVRDYLSASLVTPPQGGRSSRKWEKAKTNLVTNASSDIYDAAIELNIAWAVREVRRLEHSGRALGEAINAVSALTYNLVDEWRHLEPEVIGHSIKDIERKYSEGKKLSYKLSRSELLRLVAKETEVHRTTLRNFDQVHSRRKSK